VKAARDPLAFVGVNSIGLRRRNFTNEKIYELQDIYRALYQKGLNNRDAVQYIEDNYPQSIERDNVINFVKNSKRGIMKGYVANGGDDD
jgi:UDP-N-acetylglucosamine acyltransferase